MPNRRELRSVLSLQTRLPALPERHPFIERQSHFMYRFRSGRRMAFRRSVAGAPLRNTSHGCSGSPHPPALAPQREPHPAMGRGNSVGLLIPPGSPPCQLCIETSAALGGMLCHQVSIIKSMLSWPTRGDPSRHANPSAPCRMRIPWLRINSGRANGAIRFIHHRVLRTYHS